MKGKNLTLACGAITLIALIIIGAAFVAMSRTNQTPIAQPTPLTASGTLTCLPHKNTSPGQPQTLECAIGLKTDDGRYYGLQDASQADTSTPFTKHVKVSGDLVPPAANDRYDTEGSIKVKSFTVD